MRGLLQRDWYINRIHWWFIVASFTLIISIALISEGPFAISLFGAPLMGLFFIVNTFAIDEKANWQQFANILPITRELYVKSRYVMSFRINTITHISTFCIAFLLNLMEKELSLFLLISATSVSYGVFIFIFVFYLPVVINKSTQFAQWILIIVLLIISASVLPLLLLLIVAETVPSIFVFLTVPVIALLLFYISYRICVYKYNEKDL
ncbi:MULTISPECIES: ABC-2 transporter permease [unclassified Viridibacillus]|uniref:ABC-2 transporter permease n=1 Tax=unclassified Viridibacillus TaxID=2617942 RepID=UPI0030F78979